MFWAAIWMTVVANVAYQLCSKTSPSVHPMIGLAATYLVAFLLCLLSLPFVAGELSIPAQMKQVNASNVILGFSIVLLESGFILAFRAGWNVGYAALVSNVLATLLLVPISIVFFHNPMTPKALAGIGTVIVGLWLIVIN